MILQGGPHNGLEIEDLGKVLVRICISRDHFKPGAQSGYALYEPSQDRTEAFWVGNDWKHSTTIANIE